MSKPPGTPLPAPERGRSNQRKHLLGLASGWTYLSSDGLGYVTLPLAAKGPVAIDTLLFGSKISS